MPNHAGKTLIYQLLGNVSNRRKVMGEILGSMISGNRDPRVVAGVSHGSTLPLVKLPLPRSDEINRNLDMFTNKLLSQELPGFVGMVSLFRV